MKSLLEKGKMPRKLTGKKKKKHPAIENYSMQDTEKTVGSGLLSLIQ